MNELKPGDFGFRRKRNIEISDCREDIEDIEEKQKEKVLGIDWGNNRQETKLEEGVQDVSVSESLQIEKDMIVEEIKIGNRMLDTKRFQPKMKVQQQKLTIYIDEDLMSTLKLLKSKRVIESYSRCISEALVEYLTK